MPQNFFFQICVWKSKILRSVYRFLCLSTTGVPHPSQINSEPMDACAFPSISPQVWASFSWSIWAVFLHSYLRLKQIKYANEFSIWGLRLKEKGVAWNLQSLRVEPASAQAPSVTLESHFPVTQFPLLWNGGNNRNLIWIWHTFHELICVKQIMHAHMVNKSLFSHSFLNWYVVLSNRQYLLHSPLKQFSSTHINLF